MTSLENIIVISTMFIVLVTIQASKAEGNSIKGKFQVLSFCSSEPYYCKRNFMIRLMGSLDFPFIC